MWKRDTHLAHQRDQTQSIKPEPTESYKSQCVETGDDPTDPFDLRNKSTRQWGPQSNSNMNTIFSRVFVFAQSELHVREESLDEGNPNDFRASDFIQYPGSSLLHPFIWVKEVSSSEFFKHQCLRSEKKKKKNVKGCPI